MNKTDLCRETGIANSTIAKMTRGDDVLVSVLTRICNVLGCEIGDIVGLEEQKQLGWNVRRELSKINYRIHTDAIKQNLIKYGKHKCGNDQ